MDMKDDSGKDWFSRPDAPSDIGQAYEQMAVKDHKYFVRVKSLHFLRMIKNLCHGYRDVVCIDLGCGTAETTEYFQDKFAYTIGCDYSFGMIQFADQKHLKRTSFVNSVSEVLPLKDSSVTVAVLFNMLHHIGSKGQLMQTLREVYRILKNEGIIAIYEMNPLNPLTRHVVNTNEIDRAVNLDGYKKSLYPTTFYPWEARSILLQAGFRIRRQEYLIFFPQFFSFLLPLERFLAKIPLGGLYSVFGMK
ncbi:MAG: class I SAM-dependent methyltransferase [Candidatus Brocadia sp.]|nr:class I SAM-dependent methyltransferase [Candidatus Brocadia sp.]